MHLARVLFANLRARSDLWWIFFFWRIAGERVWRYSATLAMGFEQGYTPSVLLQFKGLFVFKDAFWSLCGQHCRSVV